MAVEQGGFGRCQDAQLTGGDKAPWVTGVSFTTARSRFFRQPQSSHVNKQMLVFYSLVHSGESGKTSHEWLEGMECQLMLHILPLCFFPFGGVGKKALRGGKWQHVFEYWLQGSVCMFVCVCVENGRGCCLGLWMFGHSSHLWDVVLWSNFGFMLKMRFQGVGWNMELAWCEDWYHVYIFAAETNSQLV